jgi:hypothetical protein
MRLHDLVEPVHMADRDRGRRVRVMSLAHAGPAATGARPANAGLDAALTLLAERCYHGTAVSQITASFGIRTP